MRGLLSYKLCYCFWRVLSHNRRKRWVHTASAAAGAILCAVNLACEGRDTSPSPGSVRSRPSSTDSRPSVRLSDGTALDGGPSRPSVAARAAERAAREAVTLDSAPERWHSWGRHLIITGDYEAAVDALEEARRARPTPLVLQDLAAAWLLTASTTQQPVDWVRALDSSLAARQPPAGSGAVPDAVDAAWRGWLGNADGRRGEPLSLATIESRQANVSALGRVDIQALREWVEDSALPGWADEHLARRPAAATRWLDAARRVAEAIQVTSGDITDRAAVHAIEQAPPTRLDELARLHTTWRTGRRQFASDAMSDMRETFRSLRSLAPSHPLAGWSACYEAIGRYYEGDIVGAEALLATTMKSAPGSGRSLKARLLWVRGTLHFHQSKFEQAVSDYVAASTLFAGLPEPANLAVVEHLLADTYESLGDTRRVWKHFTGALRAMSRHPEARRRFAAWTGAGIAAEKQELHHAAAAFFERALDEARRAGTAAALADAFHRVALARHRLGKAPSAREAMTAAVASAEKVADPGLRAKFGADLLASQALIALALAPSEAEQLARRSLASHRRVGSTFATIEVRLLLARAQRAQGHGGEAERTLASALTEIESRREQTQDAELRALYLQAYWRGYGEMVAVQADDLARPNDALSTAERARARGLLDLTSRSSAPAVRHPLTVARHLPHATRVLYLATTDTHTYAWVLGPADVAFRRLDLGRDEAARLIARLRVYLAEGRRDEATVLSTRLHQLVLDPFNEALRGVAHLVVVADPVWQQAPFAVLRASPGSPFVAERLAVSFSPSASMLKILLERPRVRLRKVAVFAAGTPPKGVALPSLPNLERESRDVIRLYTAATAYSGPEATRERFLQALADRQVVHFAGHTLRTERADGGSMLVFGDGLVSVRDLDRARIRAPVVILGGCGTARGRAVEGEGMMGLVRALLAGDTRVVVASLWDVDDRSTSRLLGRFHEAFVTTQDAAEALRRAQVALLHETGPQDLGGWAPFVVIGT